MPAQTQQLAQDAAAAMWSRDHAAKALGMAIAEVAPGSSRAGRKTASAS